MDPEWVADVKQILGRGLTVDELEMGARMVNAGLKPPSIALVLQAPIPPAPPEKTYRFESVGNDAQPIP